MGLEGEGKSVFWGFEKSGSGLLLAVFLCVGELHCLGVVLLLGFGERKIWLL